MKKLEKQREKLAAHILTLETELKMSLQKKGPGPAIDIAAYTQKIQALKVQLASLK